ncbi:MAG: APC family permease [Clostridiaceae bacterium]|jgi:APA family basic amino acid/polyamine antiporter|nr:APC family permease [Clostridiaceae bacterium]
MEKKKLGLLDSTAVLIGGMTGSAIFALSGLTIVQAGVAAILSWIIAGLILFGYGLLNAELATKYPQSGGVFIFPAKVLGKTEKSSRLWGWISSWAYLFGCWGGAAFSAIFVSVYLGVAFPAFNNYQALIAVITILFCGVLNIFDISVTGKANTLLTTLLVLALLVFAAVSFGSGEWSGELFTPFFTQGAGGASGWISAIPIAMAAYGSVVAVAFMVGEIRDPDKNVPRATFLAMVIVVALYVLVIVAVLGLVSTQYFLENPDMAYIPLYAAAYEKLMASPWIVPLISIVAVLALITTILILITLSARTIQAAAISGILPRGLGKNHKKTAVPVNATTLITVLFGALAAFPSAVNEIIKLGVLSNALVVAIICITVIVSRKKETGLKYFRAPGGNLLPIAMLLIIVGSYVPDVLSGGWQLWAVTAAYFAVGMIVYYAGTKYREKKDPVSGSA